MRVNYLFLCISVMFICSCVGSDPKAFPMRADAIILLAGSYQERAPSVAALYRDGSVPVIILANDGVLGGWSSKYQRNLYHIEQVEELLKLSGVPQNQIVRLPYYGSGTIYDALAVSRYLQMHQLQRLLLVTSDYHASRALWIFRLVLKDQSQELGVYGVQSTEPSVKNAVLEYVKMLYYRFRFGLLGLLPKLEKP